MISRVSDLIKSLNAVIEIDPRATFEFENCGSGTNVLNIYISEKAAKKLTHEDINRFKKTYKLYFDDEGDLTVTERLRLGESQKPGFFLLLS